MKTKNFNNFTIIMQESGSGFEVLTFDGPDRKFVVYCHTEEQAEETFDSTVRQTMSQEISDENLGDLEESYSLLMESIKKYGEFNFATIRFYKSLLRLRPNREKIHHMVDILFDRYDDVAEGTLKKIEADDSLNLTDEQVEEDVEEEIREQLWENIRHGLAKIF